MVGIQELEDIKGMDDDTLLKEFEDLIRNGAGPGFLLVRWMRKEILKRMDKKLEKSGCKEMYPDKEAAYDALAH